MDLRTLRPPLLALLLLAGGTAPARAADEDRQARALLEPRAEAVLSAEMAGQVVELPFGEGEAFARGDRLVAFDCAIARSELSAAAAELDRARLTLENRVKLADLNSVGELDLGLARSDVELARARHRRQQLLVERCEVLAPFDGRVVRHRVHEHESVPAGSELLGIVATGPLRVRLVVPSSWLAWVEVGSDFTLLTDETGVRLRGRLTSVGARIDPVSQTIPLLGRLEVTEAQAAALVPGMSGTASFPGTRPR